MSKSPKRTSLELKEIEIKRFTDALTLRVIRALPNDITHIDTTKIKEEINIFTHALSDAVIENDRFKGSDRSYRLNLEDIRNDNPSGKYLNIFYFLFGLIICSQIIITFGLFYLIYLRH